MTYFGFKVHFLGFIILVISTYLIVVCLDNDVIISGAGVELTNVDS